ncbi:MAG: FG-GAP-like repeat-containing protein [Phycisphaerae bacterium]|nr:FG-GAP-like repeat-containing protein [Phycisphaerae bacterium]
MASLFTRSCAGDAVARCSGVVAILLAGCTASSLSAMAPAPQEVDYSIPGLTVGTKLGLALPTDNPERFELALLIDGQIRMISAVRRSLRSPLFQVLVQNARGELVAHEAPPVRTYRGIVDGNEAHGVALQLHDGKLSGLIDLGESGTFFIQPLSELAPSILHDRAAVTHVVYDTRDVIPPEGLCGNGLFDMGIPDWIGTDGGGSSSNDDAGDGGIAGAAPQIVQIGFDSDVEFYVKNFSSIPGAVNDIEAVMNGVDFIYDRDTNIAYEFTVMVIRTEAGPPYVELADIETQLCEFGVEWNDTAAAAIPRDVAQFHTGKSLIGGVIGLAWLSVICEPVGDGCFGHYSVVQSKFTTFLPLRQALSAHELGHNWSAAHCNGAEYCHIMCASAGGCNGVVGPNLKFAEVEAEQIIAFRDSIPCDVTEQPSLSVPFLDTFPSAMIDTTKWNYIAGATASTAAANEPSASHSLNLDAGAGGSIFDFDEIRTSNLLLSESGPVLVSYWTQHTGVEADKTLSVQYWSTEGDWNVLNTITSDGTDQTTFTQWTHALPADGRHAGARLRFRNDATATNDDWFIDDVALIPMISKDRIDDDMKSDVAFHNPTTKAVTIKFLDGLTPIGGGVTSIDPPAGWVAQGMGDFDNDGFADILWRDPSNVMHVWLMNGQTVVKSSAVVNAGAVASTFSVIGIADIDGSGTADIVFRNSMTNLIHAWLMNGETRDSGGTIASAAGLQTIGVGDISGDGKADILLRTPAGVVFGWLLDGLTVTTQGAVANAPAIPNIWQIQAIGDLDGDGFADLVWRKTTTGDVSGWLMTGLSRKAGGPMGAIVPVWDLEATADINGDGKGDLLWRNTNTGQLNGWIMNGLVKTSGGNITTMVPAWTVLNR